MKLRRNLLIAAALAAMATAPAWAAPAGAPDLSGIWAHPWLPGFEALPSGPTDSVLLRRFRWALRWRHSGDRHHRDQAGAVCHDRLVRHAANPRLACCRALPAARL